MKANNGSGNNPDRDEWETPEKLYHKLYKQYGFGFDCCANSKNSKCNKYSGYFETIKDINEICWMNPPFSKEKEMFVHFFKVIDKGVAIYRCDNLETRIWQDVIFPNADWIFFPKGRVCYEGMKGKGSRFPSALIGVGVEIPKYIEGKVCKLKQKGE
jgi:hypothetical protein